MNENDIKLLRAIVLHCDDINQFVELCRKHDIKHERFMLSAVCFSLLHIGECVIGLSDGFKNKYDDIEWQKIVSMRNRLAHRYENINRDIVMRTIENQLFGLSNRLRIIIAIGQSIEPRNDLLS